MPIPQSQIASLCAQEAENLRRHLLRRLSDPTEAEDVMQDTYVRLLSARSDHPTLRNAKAFLFTVATNIAVDTMRRRQLTHHLFAPLPDDAGSSQSGEALFETMSMNQDIEDRIDAQRHLYKVAEALEVLPVKCRLAFLMHKFLDLPYAEVARHLEVSVSMVEKYLSRALLYLRNKKLTGDFP